MNEHDNNNREQGSAESTGHYRPHWDDDGKVGAHRHAAGGVGQHAAGLNNGNGNGNGNGSAHGIVFGSAAANLGGRARHRLPDGVGASMRAPSRPVPASQVTQSQVAPSPAPVAAAPRGQFDGETELLPLVTDEYYGREPELLTHRDDDPLPIDEPQAAVATAPGDVSDSVADAAFESPRRAAGGRKKMWRRVRRVAYAGTALLIIIPILAFFIAYQVVSVPDPAAVVAQLDKPITIYYADGSVMDTVGNSGSSNHVLIQPNQIPVNVRHAVEAAEDATFETNSGFDIKGIVHAAWKQVTGGSGGGSTISQEYIKKATGDDQHSYWRKFLEVVKAYKVNKKWSKDEILSAYLNIVYFGRGAYGIEAAAQAYFKKDAKDLSPSEAALLAGLIQQPGRADVPGVAQQRWKYVMGEMKKYNWITAAYEKSATYPTPIPNGSNNKAHPLSPDRQVLEQAILREVEEKDNLTEDQLKQSGAKIYTTIDPKVQQQAEDSVNKITSADKKYPDEGAALVSADPKSGNILAYYGGENPNYDQAGFVPHQPGSSFKPYTFTAGLINDPQDIGLDSVFDGSDKQTIGGHLVSNSDGESCAQCTVKDAMTQSINTVFYKMGFDVGTTKVRNAAIAAGIPDKMYYTYPSGVFPTLEDIKTHEIDGGISIGQYQVRVIDQAQGYQTFANNGMRVPLHLVNRVVGADGGTLFNGNWTGTPAFDKDTNKNAQISRNVVESMTDVAASSYDSLAGGRPNAAKTGTQGFNDRTTGKATGHNSDAWMVGFTPQIVTAVWFGNTKKPSPIYGCYKNPKGKSCGYDVYGREEPGYIWQDFMNSYLQDKPTQDFPPLVKMNGGKNFSGRPIDTYTPTQTTTSTTHHHHGSGGGNGGGTGGGGATTTSKKPAPPPSKTKTPTPPPTGGGGGGGGTGGGGGGGGGTCGLVCPPTRPGHG